MDYRLPDTIDETLKDVPVGSAVFCNSLLGGKEVGGILVVCDNNLFSKIGINEKLDLNFLPEFRNRMMCYKTWFNTYELELLFDKGVSVRVHVHPYVKVFKDFLKIVIKNGHMSVHFYNTDTTNLVSLHRDIKDEEGKTWFIRNLEKTKSIFNTSKYDDYFKIWQLEEMSQKDKNKTHYFMFDRTIKSVNYKFKKH